MGVHAQLTCATFFSEWLAHYHLVQCAWQMQTQGKGSRMHAFFLEVEREWVSGGSPWYLAAWRAEKVHKGWSSWYFRWKAASRTAL